MKAPKTIIYLIGIYCVISGTIFAVISILAICAFACAFDFTGSPLTYMIYLLYFRRNSCHRDIDWYALDVSGSTPVDQPDWPQETAAVLRTLTFAIIYLALNLSLIVAGFRAMSGVHETSRNRHFLFWSYYSFLFITFIAIIVIDFLSSAFYFVEFFLIFYNADNLLSILGINNKEEVSEFFGQISTNTRSMPSMLFFLLSSKFVLLLIINIALIYSLFTAVWKVCRDNQKQVLKIHELSKKKPPSPVMSIKSIESVHEVPPHRSDTYSRASSTPKRTAPEKPQTNPSEPPPRVDSRESQTFSATLDIPLSDIRSISSGTTVEENDIPDMYLPRVPYEKSSFQYPMYDRKTHF